MNTPCRRTVLAELGENRVSTCSCGVVHVNAGPVTLHLDREATKTLTAVLARSMVALDELIATEMPPSLRLVKTGGESTTG